MYIHSDSVAVSVAVSVGFPVADVTGAHTVPSPCPFYISCSFSSDSWPHNEKT